MSTYQMYELEVVASPGLVRDLTNAGHHVQTVGQKLWSLGLKALAGRSLLDPSPQDEHPFFGWVTLAAGSQPRLDLLVTLTVTNQDGQSALHHRPCEQEFANLIQDALRELMPTRTDESRIFAAGIDVQPKASMDRFYAVHGLSPIC